MTISKSYVLETLSLSSFFLYFIFNFFDRSVSNIFLLISLLLCMINYKSLYEVIKSNSGLVISIFVFTLYISLIGFVHNSPLNELDNYYRFLLLLPLLLISLNETRIIRLINISAGVGLVHALYYDAFYGIHLYPMNVYRYSGTSSVAITYANMCSIGLMMCMYYIFYKNNKSYLLMLSAAIFLILYMLTETRGPIIGIVLAFIYLTLVIKSKTDSSINFKAPLIVLTIFLISIFTIPNPVGENLKLIRSIDINEPSNIKNASLMERSFYLIYGIEEINRNYITGIGPQNLEVKVSQYLNSHGVKNIIAGDHLHNEFIDIAVKFGPLSLILLFFIYFFITKTENKERRILLNILMIMLISSQLTQSHFAHHQAITFFIALFYALQSKKDVE